MMKTIQARFEISDSLVGKKEDILDPHYNNRIYIFTIGFTKKNLKEFIKLLRKNQIEKVVDIRLRPFGQFAGYSNKEDLKYILEEYEKIQYQHEEMLAPTNDLLDNYRKNLDWVTYEKTFKGLLKERKVEELFIPLINGLTRICFLCSEDKPDKCHRRLVVEYFSQIIQYPFEIIHITKDDLKESLKIDTAQKILKHTNSDALLKREFIVNETSKGQYLKGP